MEKQSTKNTTSSSCSSISFSWVRGTCIGRGSFGAVSTAVNKSDGGVFAVKSVDLATCLPTQSESLENEISVLCSLKPHPHIVRFLGDSFTKEETTSFRNLHLEYLPEGDVANSVAGVGINDETLLRRYAACLVSALRHVHSQGFVHCDVKARNVLVSRSSEIKLADFGSAIGIGKSTALMTPRGSPLWMAPEVIRREYQGPESDVWSLGCTVIEMVTGTPAWEDMGIDSLSRIGFSDELPVIPVTLSENGRDFLDKCLKRDMNQRWSCDQLLEHPFLSDCHDSCNTESSPRCVLDWVNSGFELEEEEEVERSEWRPESEIAAMARICKLATTRGANWEFDSWVEVRSHASEAERAIVEYSKSSDPYNYVADDVVLNDPNEQSSDPYNDVALNDPNQLPENWRSVETMSYELVIIIFLLVKIIVYFKNVSTAIILIMYCYYQYHYDMSFDLSLKCLFDCLHHVILERTKLSFMR